MVKITKAALIIFYNSKNQILLQERGDYSKYGEKWAFFGGGIEDGETPLEAFMREAREELNLNMTQFNFKHLGQFKGEFLERVAYRDIFIIKTDLKDTDFTVLEGCGATYFSVEDAYNLYFPSPITDILDIIKNEILGKQ